MSPLHPPLLMGKNLNPKADWETLYLFDMESLGDETRFYGEVSNNNEEPQKLIINVTPGSPEDNFAAPELNSAFESMEGSVDPSLNRMQQVPKEQESAVAGSETENWQRSMDSSLSQGSTLEETEAEHISTPITVGHRKHFTDSIFMPANNYLSSSVDKVRQRKASERLRKHQSDSELFRDFEDARSFDGGLDDGRSSEMPVPAAGVMASRKTSTVRDITSTSIYKEIYADKVRLYSFLLAKELGSSTHSPEQMRKSFRHSLLRASERKDKSLQDSSLGYLRKGSGSTQSIKDVGTSVPVRKFSENLGLLALRLKDADATEAKKRPSTSVIRRKRAMANMATRRASAPQISSPRSNDPDCRGTGLGDVPTDLPSDEASSRLSRSLNPLKSKSMTSLEELDAANSSEVESSSFSSNSLKRLAEARRRHSVRQEQLKSFDDILFQASMYIRERKYSKSPSPSHSHCSNESSNGSGSPVGVTTVMYNFVV